MPNENAWRRSAAEPRDGDIKGRAQELLGLDTRTADELFSSDNGLIELERIMGKLSAGQVTS